MIVDCPSHSNFGVTLPCSSSSLCLDDVRLCLESGLQVQPGKKLSSLSNKPYKAKSAGTRRHSVPGTPTRGKNRVEMDVRSTASNLMTLLWSLEQLVKAKVFPSRYVSYSQLVPALFVSELKITTFISQLTWLSCLQRHLHSHFFGQFCFNFHVL